MGSVVGGLSVGSSFESRGNGQGREGGFSNGRKWKEEPTSPLECIDLGDPIHRWENQQNLILNYDFLKQGA